MKPAPIGNLPERDYIRDRNSGKNHWKSLVKHYEEYDQKARMMERYAQRAMKEKMKRDLEMQMSQKRDILNQENRR